ncbi:class I SAM-dependent methyltransferase [Rhodobacteraceae bacterium nBUS_22]|jgi:SAM-dependent methyltransferase
MLRKLTKNLLHHFGLELRRKNFAQNLLKDQLSWSYQREFLGRDVVHSITEKSIIDIGSGAKPNPHAAVLTDFYPDASFHRVGVLDEDRPVVVCSVEDMPFRDKSFDFSFCTHVLEHVPNLEKAIPEIARISDRGLIETPRYGKDFMLGTSKQHYWLVVPHDNELFFFQYLDNERFQSSVSSPCMRDWCSDTKTEFQEYFWKQQLLFNSLIKWENEIRFHTFRNNASASENIQEKKTASQNIDIDGNSNLSQDEINMLSQILISRISREPMYYCCKDQSFKNDFDGSRYPVIGKRILYQVGDGNGENVLDG